MVIFFDIDDTLIDHRTAIRKATDQLYEHQQLSIARDLFLANWHQAHLEHYPRFLSGELSYKDMARGRVHAVFGETIADDEADRIIDRYLSDYAAAWSLLPDVLPCLESLKSISLGIISNGRSIEQRTKLAVTGIADRFEHILISEDCGYAKPKAEIFRRACSMARVPLAQAVYVGDQYEIDACGARDAGLRGIWLDRFGRAPKERDVPTIASLDALLGVLDSRKA